MQDKPLGKNGVNWIFDRQIDDGDKYRKRLWQAHQDLFNHTFNFTIRDWNAVRNERYWNEIDKIMNSNIIPDWEKEVKKKEYTLECVIDYLN